MLNMTVSWIVVPAAALPAINNMPKIAVPRVPMRSMSVPTKRA
jgi:hypothetical protein